MKTAYDQKLFEFSYKNDGKAKGDNNDFLPFQFSTISF